MLADKVYDYLATQGKPVPEVYIETATRLVGDAIRRQLGVSESMGARLPSPSSAWYCQRRRLYDAHPDIAKTNENPRSRLVFLEGMITEATTIPLLRMAGVPLLSPDLDGKQLTLTADVEGFPLTGHMDATVDDGEGGHIPVDVKTVAEYTFRKMVEAATDPNADYWREARDDYIAQVRLYMYLIRKNGLGKADRGYLLPHNKNTRNLAELEIRYHAGEEARLLREFVTTQRQLAEMAEKGPDYIQTVPRPAWAGIIKRTAQRPDGSRGQVEEVDTIFDRERHGRDFQGYRCGYCPFIEACFPGFEKVLTSKPVWRRAV